ncbi:MAG: class I SAM-dependent methyltransferase [Candidatus Hatepunaea meridiana]|nr:class I SAM-dependent methyltransferase [Candidatus Hatepunaea meridiana]
MKQLTHNDVGKYWDDNAEAWTKLSRMGYDVYRDLVNTPAFLEMLPDVNGLYGLDIGCGEGNNTRLIADCGAHLTAFDISSKFVHYAQQKASEDQLNITHCIASAVELPFPDKTFDFAVATMSMMDLPEQEIALAEVYRILKPGGFFQFSICHPCFTTRRWKHVRDEAGREIAIECGDYFNPIVNEIEKWMFSQVPTELRKGIPKFKVPHFSKTLSDWLNIIIDAGFTLKHFVEPYADEETAHKYPAVADTRVVGYFFIVQCRK